MQKLEPSNQINSAHDSIARILSEYAISDFTFNPINEGISNTSFVVEDQKNKYVLRVYAQDSKTSDEIIFEIEFQDYLREHGIPIPLAYKNTLGGELSIVEIDGKKWQCILMQFVDGKSVTVHPSSELISELARLQAKIHILGIEFGKTKDKPEKMLADLQDSIAEKLIDIPIKTKEVLDFIERAKKYRYHLNENLPHGYNHLDIDFDGNVLVKDNAVSAIVDFDDLKYSPSVVCLGFSLWNILDDEGLDSMKYYLTEYQKVRPLNSLEMEALLHVIFFRNYVIGLIRLMLWEEGTPTEDIESLIKLEKEIPSLNL